MTAGYHTLRELQEQAVLQNREVWEIVRNADMSENERSAEASFEKMTIMYQAMKQADQSYNGALRSASGRAGGDGAKLQQYNAQGKNICGDFIGKVMEKAIKMGESNACMRRIVAAPTAGGCQAEIGSASAMAAGALASLQGGDAETIMHAAALALKNMLGLVCDPVAGLVEVPCIKRNSCGAVNAVTSAQLALAGIRSAIAPDDVIDSMRRIGNQLPACLKETSEGGLAVTESARAYQRHSNKRRIEK